MNLFIALLLAHIVGDFFTQKESWIQCKIKHKAKSIGLFKHILVHLTLTSGVVLVMLAQLPLSTQLSAIAIIVISHYAIDIWKTYQNFTIVSFLTDQSAHLLVLIAVSLYFAEPDLLALFESHNKTVFAALGVLCMYLLALKPTSLVLFLLLGKYERTITSDISAGLANVGEYIGYLERILIITFVLMNSLTAVGFLLAAKGVFRFGDMRRETDRKLTEYIMLGTLLSVVIGLLLGRLGVQILAWFK